MKYIICALLFVNIMAAGGHSDGGVWIDAGSKVIDIERGTTFEVPKQVRIRDDHYFDDELNRYFFKTKKRVVTIKSLETVKIYNKTKELLEEERDYLEDLGYTDKEAYNQLFESFNINEFKPFEITDFL